MIRQTILTAVTWIVVLVMWAYIGAGLAKQFDPEKLYPRPSYTQEYVERLDAQKIYHEKQANWYQESYITIKQLLGE